MKTAAVHETFVIVKEMKYKLYINLKILTPVGLGTLELFCGNVSCRYDMQKLKPEMLLHSS